LQKIGHLQMNQCSSEVGSLCQFYHVPQNGLWLTINNISVCITNCRV